MTMPDFMQDWDNETVALAVAGAGLLALCGVVIPGVVVLLAVRLAGLLLDLALPWLGSEEGQDLRQCLDDDRRSLFGDVADIALHPIQRIAKDAGRGDGLGVVLHHSTQLLRALWVVGQ